MQAGKSAAFLNFSRRRRIPADPEMQAFLLLLQKFNYAVLGSVSICDLLRLSRE
jgi:hypothetical protein